MLVVVYSHETKRSIKTQPQIRSFDRPGPIIEAREVKSHEADSI
jgi:hypothetical protein